MKFNHYTILGGLTPKYCHLGGRINQLIRPLNQPEKSACDRHLYIFIDVPTFFI